MLIVIEGCDFVGKTTVATALQKLIPNSVYLREPGSSPVAEGIREIMKHNELDVFARQLIMHGVRLDMLSHHNYFKDQDTVYILDRYVQSTIVYGVTDGVPYESLAEMFAAFPVPVADYTFVLLPGWDVVKERALSSATRDLDPLEGSLGRLRKIYYGYAELADDDMLFGKITPIYGQEPLYTIMLSTLRSLCQLEQKHL